MLRSAKYIEECSIGATDGTIGKVTDCYFDDEAWVIRYLVIDTGEWLANRRVLISPIAIGQPNWVEKILPVSITKARVKDSPYIDTHKPVSRQHEMRYLGYYGYSYYWGGGELWGADAYPGALAGQRQVQAENEQADIKADALEHEHDDPHLRSANAVTKYHIHAKDGDVGHVQGLLVDEKSWAIRFMIVNTSNWWVGHQVLVAPEWIDDVSWTEAKVTVDLTRQAIKDSPSYEERAPLDPAQEAGLYQHYGQSGYRSTPTRSMTAKVPH
jgi:hypothetical protein